jgi:hypothetical protein
MDCHDKTAATLRGRTTMRGKVRIAIERAQLRALLERYLDETLQEPVTLKEFTVKSNGSVELVAETKVVTTPELPLPFADAEEEAAPS